MTNELVEIRDALLKLGITGDSLFDRIRDDIDRGLIREARTQLNFVDKIVNAEGVMPLVSHAPDCAIALNGRHACSCLPNAARPADPVKWHRCKYCGERLRRDPVGQYCPTKNCQWHHGLDEKDDTPTVRRPNDKLTCGKKVEDER